MTLNRTALIKRHLEAQSDPKEIRRIAFRGRAEDLQVVHVPIKDLRYNTNLGRLILERLADPRLIENPSDHKAQTEIERLILEHPETEALLGHIQAEGQLEPGIITPDGTIINGNRRLTVLRKLWRDTKENSFQYMDVAVLPLDSTPAEIYLLEVSLQMTPETRARYGPITTIVQLREGITKYSIDKHQLANAMYINIDEIEERLAILQIIDEYLQFIRRPNAYTLLEGGSSEADHQGKYQHFFELHRIKDKHGTQGYWEAFQRHIFQLIRAGWSYGLLRELKKWTAGDVALLAAKLTPEGKPATKTRKAQSGDAEIAGLAEDLTGIAENIARDAADAATLPLPEGPARPDKKGDVEPEADSDLRTTLEAVTTVNEVVQARKASQRPAELLRQVLRKLEAVGFTAPAKGKKPGDLAEVRSLLKQIKKRLNALDKSFLQKGTK